ncbi:MAG: hypothetical protein N5837_07575 [Lactobacillus crispatus]|nr:hypothetical protein [Lactobacillus crispatus]MCT7699605.1 hypothetical protein [Lactobacillus crispatus]
MQSKTIYISGVSVQKANLKSTNQECDLLKSNYNNSRFLRRHDRLTLLLFTNLSELLKFEKVNSLILETYNNSLNSIKKYTFELRKGGFNLVNPIDFVNLSNNTALGYAAKEFSLSGLTQQVSANGLEYAYQIVKSGIVNGIASIGIDEAIPVKHLSEGAAGFILSNKKHENSFQIKDIYTSNIIINLKDKKSVIRSLIKNFLVKNSLSGYEMQVYTNQCKLSSDLTVLSDDNLKILQNIFSKITLFSVKTGQSRAASLYQGIALIVKKGRSGKYIISNINSDRTVTLVFLQKD